MVTRPEEDCREGVHTYLTCHDLRAAQLDVAENVVVLMFGRGVEKAFQGLMYLIPDGGCEVGQLRGVARLEEVRAET